jgi:hypothetical protein
MPGGKTNQLLHVGFRAGKRHRRRHFLKLRRIRAVKSTEHSLGVQLTVQLKFCPWEILRGFHGKKGKVFMGCEIKRKLLVAAAANDKGIRRVSFTDRVRSQFVF